MTKQFWQLILLTTSTVGMVLICNNGAIALTFNDASEGGSISTGTYNALLRTNGADNYTALSTFVGLDVPTLDGLASGAEIFGGSAVSQTFFANAGNRLQFSWFFNGTPAPDFSDVSFFALTVPNGVFKLADTLSSVKSGSFSYTFTTIGTYSFRFGVMDVGDNSGISQLQISNLRVGAITGIPTPALLPGLIGLGMAVVRQRKTATP